MTARRIPAARGILAARGVLAAKGVLAARGVLRRLVLTPLELVLSRVTRTSFAQRHWAPHLAGVQMSLYRRTGGRIQISALLVPTLVLIARGARSGQRRETPLMCSPQDDGTFLVAGSNWGLSNHPSWTANLIADPNAEVICRRRRYLVRAQLLSGAERAAAWPMLEARWLRYRDYERVAGRAIRVFRLSPVAPLMEPNNRSATAKRARRDGVARAAVRPSRADASARPSRSRSGWPQCS